MEGTIYTDRRGGHHRLWQRKLPDLDSECVLGVGSLLRSPRHLQRNHGDVQRADQLRLRGDELEIHRLDVLPFLEELLQVHVRLHMYAYVYL